MRRTLLALLVVALAAAPAAADYYQFTGTISFPDSSPRFLPEGVSLSGSGIGFSNVLMVRLVTVKGFTGPLTTVSVDGFTQQAIVTNVEDGTFTGATAGPPLYGIMAVGGLAQRRLRGERYAAFPLTIDAMTGLGLGAARCPRSRARRRRSASPRGGPPR